MIDGLFNSPVIADHDKEQEDQHDELEYKRGDQWPNGKRGDEW